MAILTGMELKDLYTTADVAKERKRLYDQQEGIDPILCVPVKFSESVCDHDHDTQHTRAALHRQTNAFEGKVVNAYSRCLKWLTDVPLSVILRNLADYLEKDYTKNPHHPGWLKRVEIDFKKLPAAEQAVVLSKMKIEAQPNGDKRVKAFVAGVKTQDYTYLQIKDYLRGHT